MKLWSKSHAPEVETPRFPGVRRALDGSAATVAMETAASEAAGAYPITPSTQMGEGWAAAVAEGQRNVNGRRLLFFEPEGEHAAAAVTAGMSMMGLRAANFSSGQGIAYMHESLYAAVGKRLTYVLNVAARAMTKHALNVHAGHDDYHAVDDTGFFQLFAKDVQGAADLNLIAHRIAELSLNPGICAQDGFLTSHVIESLLLPERELVKVYLGDPADVIAAPTPAQRLVFGEQRRRIPELFDFDYPAMLGVVQNQDSYAQGVAAQRPFYFDHVASLADQAFDEFAALTGRRYERAQGYRIDDAEYVIVGQGSVVSNAETVADYLRETRQLRVGVLNVTMFRPFPADLISRMLRGKRGVVVLERVDQPLAVDPPLLREIRAAMTKAFENGRAAKSARLPYGGIERMTAAEMPEFYSGCFGLGSRDLQPGDIVAAVENMMSGAAQRRQFYLGIDFIRPNTRLPKLQIWQQELEQAYPGIGDLSLKSGGDLNLMPPDAVSVRIHSVGGWGAITMGKNLAATVFDLLGLHIKANPKYGSEKKGQPTTFYASFASQPIRLNCELRHVNVVLSPDPNVFRHSNPLAGLADGGAFVIQSDRTPDACWSSFPASAQRDIKERKLRAYVLNGFGIAGDEASDVELRYRMQGAAFMGAFFAVSGLAERKGLDQARLLTGIRQQVTKKFAKYGERVIADNLRVIERGFQELQPIPAGDIRTDDQTSVPGIPDLLNTPDAREGVANPGRFWEQVCFLNKTGSDGIADPFAAFSAIPAVTGAARDMTDVRLEVPDFIAANCTGCAQCWTQCPDSAIPGLVTDIDQLIEIGIATAANGRPLDRIRQISKNLAKETRRVLQDEPFVDFTTSLDSAFGSVSAKLGWQGERRAELEADYVQLRERLAGFPIAKTAPFFNGPEAKKAGAGSLLSVTINPEACKGCNLCVAVCPDGALVTVKQEPTVVAKLRRNWELWNKLPDTPDRFVNVSDIDEGIGVLSTLLLKKDSYRSMVGGDGACMGCGEKTAVHLVISTIHALMRPRVAKLVSRLDSLISTLDTKARGLVASGANLDNAAVATGGSVAIPIDDAKRAQVELLTRSLHALQDLRWRYVEGPSGEGRAMMGMANSTGCSSVWASTYPYNPYPFPWANHLFQDSPSLAIGLFEGHMRKMADAFAAIRRAELLASDSYDAARDETLLSSFDWQQFSDEEFDLCPPIVSMGGDGAMLDIGFQNLSRLLASGKPIRVIVLDTQVYSNTGGQACTSGFTGQISDMATYGAAQHGKTEVRKELALVAMAHRGAYVLQSSQASASHLVAGVLRGLQKRRPAVFNIYTPCPVEHGLADDWSLRAARLALESRAFPFLTFDPDNGPLFADALSLDGNPSVETSWPEYTIEYLDDAGTAQRITLPLTIADWAATEGRFRKHFKAVDPSKWNEDMVPFHEFLGLSSDDRDGKTAYILTTDRAKHLSRLAVSNEIVRLAEERQQLWAQLRELAGLAPAASVRDRLVAEVEAEFDRKLQAVRADYETKLAAMPKAVAQRMAEALLRTGSGKSIADLLASITATPPTSNGKAPAAPIAASAPTPAPVAPSASTPSPQPAAAVQPVAVSSQQSAAATAVEIDPYIESARCTSCNECINLNGKLFGYNASKQAEIKDADAGTFQQLVTAAERCPVGLIHPGTPRNPKEKDLAKWLKRAEPFN
ncbi:MAG TPA: 2-oxoacid:acceptor oxidoreductase family protein [Gemmatimonadaceae bacterium]|nr:2-oxoacid:acceptor oxidoreductase family protein [Gemmatimonadaceae bacterium]